MINIDKKYGKLFNNSVIFAVGNLGSKLITFLLVPLYTYVLSTKQYGTVDLLTTITSMLLPILSLCLYDAVLRFAIKSNAPEKVLNTSLSLVNLINIIIVIISVIVYFFTKEIIIILLGLILVCQNLQSILSQYSRAIGRVKLFAINGIIMTFILMISNIVFLVIFNLGIIGYLISIILANLGSIIFLLVQMNVISFLDLNSLDTKEIKKLLHFSLPLIPNSLMWWVINASSRLFIVYYVDVSQNGLFAVSSKIPTILNVVYAIFFQAWQLSAIEEYESTESSKFYSEIFNYLSLILIFISSFLIVFIQPIVRILLSSSYYSAWKIIPLLLIANLFSSFSSFVGTTYTVSMKTRGVFLSSSLGALISVIINFILIPTIGIIGAAISQVLSFLFIWVFRHIETNKMVKIDLSFKIIISIFFLTIQAILVFFINSSIILLFIQLVLIILILIINFSDITYLFKNLKK